MTDTLRTHKDIPISFSSNSKFDIPYTTNTLRLETLSSLAQKLLLDGKAKTEEEALIKAEILIKKIGHLEIAPIKK